MSPVDADLVELLEGFARRNEDAADGVLTRLASVERRLAVLERRSEPLVVETKDADGEIVSVEPRKTGNTLTTVLAIFGVFVTPVSVALITVLGS